MAKGVYTVVHLNPAIVGFLGLFGEVRQQTSKHFLKKKKNIALGLLPSELWWGETYKQHKNNAPLIREEKWERVTAVKLIPCYEGALDQ